MCVLPYDGDLLYTTLTQCVRIGERDLPYAHTALPALSVNINNDDSAALIPRSVFGVAPILGSDRLVLFGGEVDPSSEGHMVRCVVLRWWSSLLGLLHSFFDVDR